MEKNIKNMWRKWRNVDIYYQKCPFITDFFPERGQKPSKVPRAPLESSFLDFFYQQIQQKFHHNFPGVEFFIATAADSPKMLKSDDFHVQKPRKGPKNPFKKCKKMKIYRLLRKMKKALKNALKG